MRENRCGVMVSRGLAREVREGIVCSTAELRRNMGENRCGAEVSHVVVREVREGIVCSTAELRRIMDNIKIMRRFGDANSSWHSKVWLRHLRVTCKTQRHPQCLRSLRNRRRHIFPGGCPPSIVSAEGLNFRVRDENG